MKMENFRKNYEEKSQILVVCAVLVTLLNNFPEQTHYSYLISNYICRILFIFCFLFSAFFVDSINVINKVVGPPDRPSNN